MSKKFSELNQAERDYCLDEWTSIRAETHQCILTTRDRLVTFLVAANGGGAAAVLAFIGTGKGHSWFPLIALVIFVLGFLSIGLAQAYSFRRAMKVSAESTRNVLAAMDDKIPANKPALDYKGTNPFRTWENVHACALASFFLFGVGCSLGVGLLFASVGESSDKKPVKALQTIQTNAPSTRTPPGVRF